MDNHRPTYYEVLGIGSGASAEEIERAYRFSLELYGDGALATYSLLDPEEVRTARLRVQEAYETLSDPLRRHEYDLAQGLLPPGTPPPARGPTPLRAVSPIPSLSELASPSSRSFEIPGARNPEVASGRTEIASGPSPLPLPGHLEEVAAGSPPAPRESAAAEPVSPPVATVTAVIAPAPPGRAPSGGAAPAASAPLASPAPVPSFMAAGLRAPTTLADPITGSALRRFREERGITLREIANQSKIGTRFLEYIEGDRHDMLPAPVYLRGFLQEYARAVGLDPKSTADGYMAQFPRPWPAS